MSKYRNFFLILGFIIIGLLCWFFKTIVGYILISAVIAMIARPLVARLRKFRYKRVRLGNSASALIALVIIWLVVFGFFVFIIPLLASKFQQFGNINVESFMKQIKEPLTLILNYLNINPSSLNDGTLLNMVGEKISTVLNVSQVTNFIGAIFGVIGEMLIAAFSISFITFFFLSDDKLFSNSLLLILPANFTERFEKSFQSIESLLRRYFVGLLLEISIVMVLSIIGLTIIGINFSDAVVIGFICGLFNVIPYLGPWIGALFGMVIAIALNINADFMLVILPLLGYMIIVFAAVQLIDNNLLQPIIYSNSIKAHPLEIFLVILAAGSFGGIVGMIIAIPVYTVFKVLSAEFLSSFRVIHKLTENIVVKPEVDPEVTDQTKA